MINAYRMLFGNKRRKKQIWRHGHRGIIILK
jgi:hypothetical protein